MPLAFFFVAMITLVGGWYHAENQAQEAEMIRESEAQAVAANIVAYNKVVMDCARYESAPAVFPYWSQFASFNGYAADFLNICRAGGFYVPDWLPPLFAGVNMTINSGRVQVTYTPGPGMTPRAGVQAHLLEMTDYGIIMGRPIEGY